MLATPGLACIQYSVALQTVAGFALHRRWCAAQGKPRWLGTTSPYLFRNPGQAKLWAAVCP